MKEIIGIDEPFYQPPPSLMFIDFRFKDQTYKPKRFEFPKPEEESMEGSPK